MITRKSVNIFQWYSAVLVLMNNQKKENENSSRSLKLEKIVSVKLFINSIFENQNLRAHNITLL